MTRREDTMREQCIDCAFFSEENPDADCGEMCFLDPDWPVEINYSDPACQCFELSESAAAERRKQPGEL